MNVALFYDIMHHRGNSSAQQQGAVGSVAIAADAAADAEHQIIPQAGSASV